MESENSVSTEVDEVNKLRDQIKNLTFENNLLRRQTQSKKFIFTTASTSGSNYSDLPVTSPIDIQNEIVEINEDFLDEETWLYVSKKHPKSPTSELTGIELQKWLRHGVDDNNDYDFQVMRRSLINKLGEMQIIQQGSRRNNIDTRTFTRPKKQMSRPGLRSMVESPLLEYRELMPTMQESLTSIENIEDLSMPFNSTYSSLSIDEQTLSNDDFQTIGGHGLNATFQQVENTRNILFQKLENSVFKNSALRRSEDTKLNTTYRNRDSSLNSTFTKILSEPHLNTTTELRLAPSFGHLSTSHQKGSSDPDSLNLTFNKSERSMLAHLTSREVEQKQTILNSTFDKPDLDSPLSHNGTFKVTAARNGASSKRAASCDSIDDDFSSTSDNGSTNNRILNADDVQNIARLQEESLHLVMSTPRSDHRRVVPHDDDLPSPISTRGVDVNHGYQSDYSDHSSVAKSSRSSQVSSPTSSLHGSTNMLAYDNGRGGMKLELPKMRPAPTVTKSRPTSGLRAPTSRPVAGRPTSGLPRPTTNIPRPQSRIPAPKTRKPTAESLSVSNKNSNWTDGCY